MVPIPKRLSIITAFPYNKIGLLPNFYTRVPEKRGIMVKMVMIRREIKLADSAEPVTDSRIVLE